MNVNKGGTTTWLPSCYPSGYQNTATAVPSCTITNWRYNGINAISVPDGATCIWVVNLQDAFFWVFLPQIACPVEAFCGGSSQTVSFRSASFETSGIVVLAAMEWWAKWPFVAPCSGLLRVSWKMPISRAVSCTFRWHAPMLSTIFYREIKPHPLPCSSFPGNLIQDGHPSGETTDQWLLAIKIYRIVRYNCLQDTRSE